MVIEQQIGRRPIQYPSARLLLKLGQAQLLLFLAGVSSGLGQTKASLSPVPNLQFFNTSSGTALPCSNCKLESYLAGTNTPLNTYSDSSASGYNPTTIVMNSGGHTPSGIWMDGACYKFVLKSANGDHIWTQDNICDSGQMLRAGLANPTGSAMVSFRRPGTASERSVQSRLTDVISVLDFGAKGDGVADDTAAISDAIAYMAKAGGGTLYFPSGTYNTSGTTASVDFLYLSCALNATIRHTGQGTAVTLGNASKGNYAMGMENCTISGGPSTISGLVLNQVNHGNFTNIRVLNAPNEFGCFGCVLDTFVNMRVTLNETGTSVACKVGMLFDSSPPNTPNLSQANVIINPIVEGCSMNGILLDGAEMNRFIGGTAEHSMQGATAIATTSNANYNIFDGIDTECNAATPSTCAVGSDYNIQGIQNVIRNPISTGTTTIAPNALFTELDNGLFTIVVDNGTGTRLGKFRYTTLTLNGTGTNRYMTFNLGSAGPPDPWLFGGTNAVVVGPSLASEGVVRFSGTTGVWARSFGAVGSGGTFLGGFGVAGTADDLGEYYVGTNRAPVASFGAPGNVSLPSIPKFANNSAAIAGGLTPGRLYRTGADPDPIMIVH
jgi:hypothetical protein